MRQLGKSDLPAVERHLLDLGPLDRGARFLGYASDAAIAGYVRGIDPSHTVLIGGFDPSDRMVGLAEAHPTNSPHTVEVAVSIDLAFRRYGLGQRLVARALTVAFARGIQSAEFLFAPDNFALAGLVQTLGGRIMAPGYASIDRSAVQNNYYGHFAHRVAAVAAVILPMRETQPMPDSARIGVPGDVGTR